MEVPVQISFHDLEHDDRVETKIQRRAEQLERYFDRITSCRVVVEAPHRSPANQVLHYRVRVEVTVPNKDLVVTREPTEEGQEKRDLDFVIDRAFDAMERRLKKTKAQMHDKRPPADVERTAEIVDLFKDDGYGFIETDDGRRIYFNANAVIDADFDKLEEGTQVRFVQSQPHGSPQPAASTVEVLS